MTESDRTPLTLDRLRSEPDCPAWRQRNDGATVPKSPGVYAHVTRVGGYVLYVGTGSGQLGLYTRLQNQYRWVGEIRDSADDLETRRRLHEPVLAGLAEHDFDTWYAETADEEEALGWELYFQGLAWRMSRRRLPLFGWSVKAQYAGDWIRDLLDSEATAAAEATA